MPSQPTRAAWIEIREKKSAALAYRSSQPTRAAWIEIVTFPKAIAAYFGRSPLGLRGLKSSTKTLSPNLNFVAAHSGCVD